MENRTARVGTRRTGSAPRQGCFWPLESEILLFQGDRTGPGKKKKRRSRDAKEEGGKHCCELSSRHKRELRWAGSCYQSLCLHRPHEICPLKQKPLRQQPGLCSTPWPALPPRCSQILTPPRRHNHCVTSGRNWFYFH